ncbi:hypothetical protein TEA_005313 [Camellia sinensis var. sinensis]|uniref:ATP synthase F1 complex delta/epsilon subunit N-terminal domain-containing protein n=1 Tax=Camellia sinensis var. sinensis TaxID=542762 RepID=A0A4S4EHK8_CAMSN|nr:hypothetical protein TEA_005313 [Camellia sinensis var. sinensis]
MFRQITTRILSRSTMAFPAAAAATRARPFSTHLPAATTGDETFVESWKKVIPNIEPPKTAMAFMTPRPFTPSSIPSKLSVNFVLPYSSELSTKEYSPVVVKKYIHQEGGNWVYDIFTVGWTSTAGAAGFCVLLKVDMVIIPASTGQMGVLPGHVATITELKPGILSVHEGNEVTKYFVSSGFAFIHANSYADIIAVEAVPIDQIDPSLVQKGLAEFTQKLNSATTDLEKAEAQIGVDVHSALNTALSG